ncbi:MAG TPA: hypothetical protein VGO62_01755 [Myxococcota bacterium]|jgi:hypothetical protein
MRALWLALSLVVAAAACGPAGDACCEQTLDCAKGAQCFEGRCRLTCDDTEQCNDGETCDATAGVCTESDPDDTTLASCPYDGAKR